MVEGGINLVKYIRGVGYAVRCRVRRYRVRRCRVRGVGYAVRYRVPSRPSLDS